MTRLRSPSSSTSGPPSGAPPDRRASTVFALKIALTVCTITACALAVPNMVFGASGSAAQQPPSDSTTQQEPVAAAARPDNESPSEGSLLFTLPWGSGEGEVGLARPVEGLTRGPEALAVAGDGRMAVLDSVNRRVLFLDGRGQCVDAAEVPLAEPRFLAVDDERLYVLDCDADRLLVTMDWSGATVATAALPELPDVVTGLFATSEGACVEVIHNEAFLVAGTLQAAATAVPTETAAERSAKITPASLHRLTGRPIGHDIYEVMEMAFTPDTGARLTFYDVDKDTLVAKQWAHFAQPLAPGHELEHLVSVDGDGDGGLIVGARILDRGPKAQRRASLALTRLASDGHGRAGLHAPVGVKASDVLLLGDSSYAYLGRPYVVAPDGRILQPLGSDGGYSVFVHSFGHEESSDRPMEVQP